MTRVVAALTPRRRAFRAGTHPAGFGCVSEGTSSSARRDHSVSSRTLVGVLCLLVGLTALGGGVSLVLYPDGSRTQLPLALLRHSPFTTYLVPGLLLSLIVGLGNTIAGVVALRGGARARALALLGGGALLVWIVSEMLLLRTTHWLQVVYLCLGALIVAESLAPTHRNAWRA
jgi:hypothetical protein